MNGVTPHLRLKPGAAFPTLAPAGFRLLAALDYCAQRLNLTLTLTSGSEQRGRSPLDPHMTGEAVDVRVNDLTFAQIRALYMMLGETLGPAFTVLLEAPTHDRPQALADIIYRNEKATALHLHLQRKKGTTWPPREASSEVRRT